ncbi:MAG: hypothetical protein Q8N05_00165 [Bacteroidota bacterium]|nr:hypothetical protein [Bacteroidota bacterium]
MKNKIKEIAKKEIDNFQEKKISRKDAIKKTGYFAVSAATMMILLSNPNKAQAASPAPAAPNKWGVP